MKNKNILALCVAVPLFIACTPAKQTGKDFQWGELPQQPDLSWVDSVGSRQEPINHITLSANSLGAVADSTVLSTTAIQKAIDCICFLQSFFSEVGYFDICMERFVIGVCELGDTCQ